MQIRIAVVASLNKWKFLKTVKNEIIPRDKPRMSSQEIIQTKKETALAKGKN